MVGVMRALRQAQSTYLGRRLRRILPYQTERKSPRRQPIGIAKGYRDALCNGKDAIAEWLSTVDPSYCKLASTREQLRELQGASSQMKLVRTSHANQMRSDHYANRSLGYLRDCLGRLLE